jgi:hypothetical protein
MARRASTALALLVFAACGEETELVVVPREAPPSARVSVALVGGASSALREAVVGIRELYLVGAEPRPRLVFLRTREAPPLEAALTELAEAPLALASGAQAPAGLYPRLRVTLHGGWITAADGRTFASPEGTAPPLDRLDGVLESDERTPTAFEVELPAGPLELTEGSTTALLLGLLPDADFAELEPGRWSFRPRLAAIPRTSAASLAVELSGLDALSARARAGCALTLRDAAGTLLRREPLETSSAPIRLDWLFPHAGPFTLALEGTCEGDGATFSLSSGERARREVTVRASSAPRD